MCLESRSSTVIAVEWMVRLREARFGTRVPITLLMMGTRALCMTGTMVLKTCRA